jgi:hypothetical protein
MDSEMVSKCCGFEPKFIGVSGYDKAEYVCQNCGKPCEVVPKEEQPQMVRCPTTLGKNCDSCFESGEHLAQSCKTITRLPTCPACVPVEPAVKPENPVFNIGTYSCGDKTEWVITDTDGDAIDCPSFPSEQEAIACREILELGYRMGMASTLSVEEILKVVELEPEYPGEIPDEVYETIKELIRVDSKEGLTNIMRMSVKLTKKNIAEAIHNLMGGK